MTEPRVAALLVADAALFATLVVVRGKHPRVVWPWEQPLGHRVPQLAGVAALKVGASARADEQRIAGEHAIAEVVADAFGGVTGRRDDFEDERADRAPIAAGDAQRVARDGAVAWHDRPRATPFGERV